MQLVKPSVEILHINTDALQLIETAGRTCYKSEDKITADSAPKFSEMILKRGHESVLEHATASARFICDRGVTHEIVRHRIASYSQESTRYCDYGGAVAFVIPPWVDIEPGEYTGEDLTTIDDTLDRLWFVAMAGAEADYQHLREMGWRPEQARSVLPNSLKTEIVMTANLREWRHFFKLRCSPAAHPQMREVAIPLLAAMHAQIPVIFDDMTC
ncbi:FAD-dependent thymidylate synthase [Oryzomonas rubra]|uniref:FAD-dependent thymidylate synthase n=1 Tax=Oryzomonas rubra TaxID=2509454 RepID=A0A5A9X8K2_9BACT|nr:FAD-dependent thymidylate synthase [Oryzomonas rubra]KAA0888725.1 FAD-dependent thymidylate synthase [Oryzomonas rubra]